MARVFVSYAGADLELAREVRGWLIEAGHEVFLDRDPRDGITVGERWEQRLYEWLCGADAVVCVVTSAYVVSPWCTAEVGAAQARGSRVLPLRAELGVVHPLLVSTQHTDYVADPVQARTALVEALRQVDLGWPSDRSPFPGLRPFEADRHRVFFGRAQEVRQLAELLRSPAERAEGAVLLVAGPSGCGKSSLVRAGLLPVIADEPGWRVLPPILPGADPVVALARELATAARRVGLDWTVADVCTRLDQRGVTGLVDDLLLADPAGPQQRLLIVVDQFEELLTRAPPAARARFAELLRPALTGPVRVVATLRPEFFNPLLLDPGLAALPTRPYPVRPLRREALRSVIEKPARLAGIEVDDGLVDQLVEDTDTGEALPLLAFTLAQLADGVTRGGRLSQARYDQLGGVHGAVTHQADTALAEAIAAGGRSRKEVIAGLLRLVTVDEQGRPTRWRVHRGELPEQVCTELDAFVARRLLSTDSNNGAVVIGVAHEAFLSAWSPLAQAIAQNVSALRARRAVEQAATEWHDEGRPPARLWERSQLAAVVADTGARVQSRDLVTDSVDLSPTACTFLHASIRRDRAQRGRAIIVLSVLLVLAVAAAAVAVIQRRDAEQQRNVAVSQRVAAQALELSITNPALAAQLSLAVYQFVPTPEARGSLLSTVASLNSTPLTGHTNFVKGVAVSPEGHVLATGSDDRTVRLWDIRDLRRPHLLSRLTGHNHYVPSVAFSPGGDVLASASDDKTARLWDVRDPRQPSLLSILPGHTDVVISVAFSPEGHVLATGSYDGTVRLWDIRDLHRPNLLHILTGHTSGLNSVAFNPDGHTLATASSDTTVGLWDIRDPHQPIRRGTLTGHSGGVSSVAFSIDGHTLASGSYDSTVRLWDIHDPRQPILRGTIIGHSGNVNSVAFSIDGHTLATAGDDRTARLWDIRDPHRHSPLNIFNGHTNSVTSVAFTPDGHTLASSSYDTTARLWDLSAPIIAGHTTTVSSVTFNSDGRILATASRDSTARLWDVRNPHQPHPLATLNATDDIDSVAFSPDGHTAATASDNSTTLLWDVHDPRQPMASLPGHTGGVDSVAFSSNGHTLAIAGDDSTTRLLDVQNTRQPMLLASLRGHTSGVESVAFSPNRHILATASADKTVRLWNVKDPRHPSQFGTLIGHTNVVSSVAFSPDGYTVATVSHDTTVKLWNVHDPHHPHLLHSLIGHGNSVNRVAFSPDGHTLATASSDRTVRLWDIRDLGRPNLLLGTLTGHTSGVNSVAFSPDGHTLATASVDSTVRLWETDVETVATRICSLTPTITPNEWNQYLPTLPYRPPCP